MFRKIQMHFASEEAERAKALNTAELITSLEDTEGWKAFTGLAKDLAESLTPEISQFVAEEASVYASRLTFVSGIKRCIGLMDQQKEILSSLKKTKTT